MDEIFHVPQAQKYCDYKFDEWDPKITTLPGLYFISFACLRALAFALGHELDVVCTTFFLRMINVLFLMGNVLLLRQILIKLHCDKTQGHHQPRKVSRCPFTLETLMSPTSFNVTFGIVTKIFLQ